MIPAQTIGRCNLCGGTVAIEEHERPPAPTAECRNCGAQPEPTEDVPVLKMRPPANPRARGERPRGGPR